MKLRGTLLGIALALATSACGCSGGQCGSDNDCKGDRICEQGACVAPPATSSAQGTASPPVASESAEVQAQAKADVTTGKQATVAGPEFDPELSMPLEKKGSWLLYTSRGQRGAYTWSTSDGDQIVEADFYPAKNRILVSVRAPDATGEQARLLVPFSCPGNCLVRLGERADGRILVRLEREDSTARDAETVAILEWDAEGHKAVVAARWDGTVTAFHKGGGDAPPWVRAGRWPGPRRDQKLDGSGAAHSEGGGSVASSDVDKAMAGERIDYGLFYAKSHTGLVLNKRYRFTACLSTTPCLSEGAMGGNQKLCPVIMSFDDVSEYENWLRDGADHCGTIVASMTSQGRVAVHRLH